MQAHTQSIVTASIDESSYLPKELDLMNQAQREEKKQSILRVISGEKDMSDTQTVNNNG